MPSVAELARDLGRTFRERPALVVGAGAIGLIGLAALNRNGGGGSGEAEAPADPAAGLFPGVGTYGGSIPGSGSVPFAGYPSPGGGSIAPPDYSAPPPPPPLYFGLACNGERQPDPLGIPGAWQCTADGWRWSLPDNWPPPTSAPAPAPAPTPAPAPAPTSSSTSTASPGYTATVTRATHLWNDSTKRWVYTLAIGTKLSVRGARYTKGGVSCYPVSGPAPYSGGVYYVPASNVRLG